MHDFNCLQLIPELYQKFNKVSRILYARKLLAKFFKIVSVNKFRSVTNVNNDVLCKLLKKFLSSEYRSVVLSI